MPVFDPFTAASLFILASAGTTPVCQQPEMTKINIIPKTDGIEYDYKQGLARIQAQTLTTSTKDPYDMHGGSITQGFMEGQVNMSRGVELDHSMVGKNKDMACIWYKSIDVTIEIDPKIVIANEINRDRCMGPAVLEHEKKHINVDRRVVNQAAQIIAKRLYDEISASGGFIRGPLEVEQAQAQANEMIGLVKTITQEEFDRMGVERQLRQDEVDTRSEYDRVASLCPNFHERQRALYQKAIIARDKAKD
jgi:hypothetical protein